MRDTDTTDISAAAGQDLPDAPVPFSTVLFSELEEIRNVRRRKAVERPEIVPGNERSHRRPIVERIAEDETSAENVPVAQDENENLRLARRDAQMMGLFGLAISGGG